MKSTAGLLCLLFLLCTWGCGNDKNAADSYQKIEGLALTEFTDFVLVEKSADRDADTGDMKPEASDNEEYSLFTVDKDEKVYSGADEGASVIGSLDAGSEVRCLGSAADGSWSRISFNGRVAYISVYKEGTKETSEASDDNETGGGHTYDQDAGYYEESPYDYYDYPGDYEEPAGHEEPQAADEPGTDQQPEYPYEAPSDHEDPSDVYIDPAGAHQGNDSDPDVPQEPASDVPEPGEDPGGDPEYPVYDPADQEI